MISKRLENIISFVSKDDYVADIGTDHGYIPIKLKKNNLCKEVVATDINENALNIAKKNIKENNLKIKTYLSDGLTLVLDRRIDTLIIAGMGAASILHIIDTINDLNIKKIIVQSNNDLDKLRISMQKKGFYLQDEKVVFDKKHYYVIDKYTKNKRDLRIFEKHFGIYKKENTNYYNYLYQNISNIKSKIKKKYIFKRIKFNYKLYLLRRVIKRK